MVVTGAGQGLGRAFAERAAREGAAVVVNDVEGELAEAVATGIRGFGGRASVSINDVAVPEQAKAIIDRCVDEFGAIHGLVNNAGIRHESAIAEEIPERAKKLIEVNVLGTLYCTSRAVQLMQQGSIVNLGSVSMVGQPGVTAYSASKGAVASLTAGWAVELKDRGIRVNAICPVARTGMGDQGDPPENVAPLVTFLLGDQSAHITGQLIRFAYGKLFAIRQMAPQASVEGFAALTDQLEVPPKERWL